MVSNHIDTIRAAVVSAWPEKVPAALAALEQLAAENARLRAACEAAVSNCEIDGGNLPLTYDACNKLRAALGEAAP